MKNLLTLSLLCATVAATSMRAEQPIYTEIANPVRVACVDGSFIYKVESTDASGHIHALIASDAPNNSLQVGDLIVTMGSENYYIDSIEQSEDPAYLRVVLSVVLLETCSEQE